MPLAIYSLAGSGELDKAGGMMLRIIAGPSMADTLIVYSNGRVVQKDTPAEVFNNLQPKRCRTCHCRG